MPNFLEAVNRAAVTGVEATRDMLATKGRASFLAERSLGHIDAGAKTSQLMITAVIDVLSATPTQMTGMNGGIPPAQVTPHPSA